MNEETKGNCKKLLIGLFKVIGWFVLFCAVTIATVLILAQMDAGSAALGMAIVMVYGLLVLLILWLACRRNFRRFLFVIACLVTGIGLFYAQENWRGKRAWETFKREWEAKGERFDRASVVPPPMPDDQNFALTPVVASSYGRILDRNGHKLTPPDTNIVNRLEMPLTLKPADWPGDGAGSWEKGTLTDLKPWQEYYRRMAATTNFYPVAPQPQSPAADVLLALGKYDSTIEALRQAARLPYSRFPLEYDAQNTAAILLPHLAAMKGCCQVLRLRALAELQTGQTDRALDDVKLLLRLTESIRTEPLLISHLVRIAMVNIALQPIWEGLAEQQWSEAQLVELDRELAKLDFLADYQLAMRGELILYQLGISDYLRRHPERIYDMFGENSMPPVPVRFLPRLIPGGWYYQNQFRCARMTVQYYLPTVDLKQRVVPPAAVRRADAALEAEVRVRNPYHLFEGLMLPALGKAVKKFASGQNAVDLARVGCALERYRLAHGNYPETLDALVPQFIAKIPHDILNGQPLKYRRTDDGNFILYSVGWNETDDNGELPSRKKVGGETIDAGDWVWRYPAKPE